MTAGALRVQALSVEVSRREVLHNLGYPKSRAPSDRVARVLDEGWSSAVRQLDPRGAHRIVTRVEAAAAGMPEPSEQVGVGICTIGKTLEEEVRRLSAEGQLLEALILDAVGSTAAEAAADALNLSLCQEGQALGFHLPARISPGYGRWKIEGQPALLGLLPTEALGVSLTEGLMMVPRKSVSFGVRFLHEPPQSQAAGSRCSRCDLEGCAFRRDEYSHN